ATLGDVLRVASSGSVCGRLANVGAQDSAMPCQRLPSYRKAKLKQLPAPARRLGLEKRTVHNGDAGGYRQKRMLWIRGRSRGRAQWSRLDSAVTERRGTRVLGMRRPIAVQLRRNRDSF